MSKLRQFTRFVLLLLLAGIYAMPLAAALNAARDCCAGGMCPVHRHSAKSQPSDEPMPDCGMGAQKHGSRKSIIACSCEPKNGNAISVGLFVMPRPARIIFSGVTSPIVRAVEHAARVSSQLPETPPPRIQVS